MTAPPEGPFPGLLPFAPDSPWLFGRSRDIRRITDNVLARPLTVLFGPSGVGKSSLLRAGVVPALGAESDVDGRVEVVVCDRWAGGAAESLRRAFGTSEDTAFPDVVAVRAADAQLVTVLDQFEELFVRGDAHAPEVADLVATLLEHGRVLISLREDAVVVLKHLEREVFHAFDGLLRVDHLTVEDGREAITRPIAKWDAEVSPASIEPELVDAVLEGLVARAADGRDSVRAPQLQIVMVRLWDESAGGDGHRLTLGALRDLDGTATIIREYVDRELTGYKPADQRVAGEMLRRMVTPSGAKIAHRLTDLAEFAGVPKDAAAEVLARLTSDSRIVEALDDNRYQLAHDALAVPVLEWCRRLDGKQARRRTRWRLFATIGFVAAILMALVLADAFGPIESYTVGAAFELRGAEKPPPGVVLVGIDSSTLDDHLKTGLPVKRVHHADALDWIMEGQPRAVAFDLYFDKAPTSGPGYRAFAESVYGADRPVVLAAPVADNGKTNVFGGAVTDLGARPGLDAVREDAGGVVRRPLFRDFGVKSLSGGDGRGGAGPEHLRRRRGRRVDRLSRPCRHIPDSSILAASPECPKPTHPGVVLPRKDRGGWRDRPGGWGRPPGVGTLRRGHVRRRAPRQFDRHGAGRLPGAGLARDLDAARDRRADARGPAGGAAPPLAGGACAGVDCGCWLPAGGMVALQPWSRAQRGAADHGPAPRDAGHRPDRCRCGPAEGGAMRARLTAALCSVLLGALLVCTPAAAELYAPRSGFVPNDVVTAGWFGAGAALSADGQTAVVGAPFAAGGRVLFLTRVDSGWVQQGPAFAPTHTGDDARIGFSVAISGDGNTAVVGAPQDNANHGSAWIFTRSNGVWSQSGPSLAPADEGGLNHDIIFGYGVDISTDGSTVAIGSFGDAFGYGAVRIYVRSGSSWVQQGAKLKPSSESQSWFGSTVALSANGSTLMAGAQNDSSGNGAVWVFTRSGSTWSQQGGKLAPPDPGGSDGFGLSLALSSTGDYALVGAPGTDEGVGAVWSYSRSSGAWSPDGPKLTPTATGATGPDFGRSVALDASATKALIGSAASYYTAVGNGTGSVIRLGRASTSTNWTPIGTELEGDTQYGSYARFGAVVDLSADGASALITAPGDNDADGIVYLYVDGTEPDVTPLMWGTVAQQLQGDSWQIWSAVDETADVVTGTLTIRVYRIRPDQLDYDLSEGCSGTPVAVLRGPVGSDSPHSLAKTLTLPGLGVYAATATFDGDAQNLPSGPTFCEGFSHRRPTAVSVDVVGDVVVGSHVTITPKLTGAQTPSGDLHLRIYATPATCDTPLADYTFDASEPLPSVDFVPKSPGSLWFELLYDGDNDDSGAGVRCEEQTPTFLIDRAHPALQITPGASTVVGGAVSASVRLSGGASPTGSVHIELHSPDDTTCQGVPLARIEVPIGDGHISSGEFATSRIGVYRFTAAYAGDVRNHVANTDCAAGAVTVGRRQPRLLATPSVDTRGGDPSLTTTVTVADGFQPSGNVQIAVYGPNDRTCRGPAAFIATVPLVDGVATLPPLGGAERGRYDFIVGYPGDTGNEPARLDCGASSTTVRGRAASPPSLRVPKPTAKKGSIRVKIICDGAASQKCVIDVTLTVQTKRRRGRIVGVARTQRTLVGRRSLTIAGGASRTITVKLNKVGNGLLKRFTRLHVTLTALTDDSRVIKRVTLRRKRP